MSQRQQNGVERQGRHNRPGDKWHSRFHNFDDYPQETGLGQGF